MKEKTMKDQVKEIFQTKGFDEAIKEVEMNFKQPYVEEYGEKSWKALMSYYKKANIQQDEMKEASETEVEEVVPQETAECIKDETGFVDYMLYANHEGPIKWFGHMVNYKKLERGEVDMMIRMNNHGVSKGICVNTVPLSLEEIGVYHTCYGVIINMKEEYSKQLELCSTLMNNLPKFMERWRNGAIEFPENVYKLTDAILNLK